MGGMVLAPPCPRQRGCFLQCERRRVENRRLSYVDCFTICSKTAAHTTAFDNVRELGIFLHQDPQRRARYSTDSKMARPNAWRENSTCARSHACRPRSGMPHARAELERSNKVFLAIRVITDANSIQDLIERAYIGSHGHQAIGHRLTKT